MKITKEEFHSMVNDDFSRSHGDRKKRHKRRTDEGKGESGPLYEIEAQDLIEFAKAWSSLSDAVLEQLDDIIDDPENADANLKAVDLLERRLGGFNEEIDEAIALWREVNERDEEDDEDDDKFDR